MKKVIDVGKLNIDELIKNEENNSKKQRLIVFKMQIDGLTPTDSVVNGFSVFEIKDYCRKNKIDFEPSDDYGFSNVHLI